MKTTLLFGDAWDFVEFEAEWFWRLRSSEFSIQ